MQQQNPMIFCNMNYLNYSCDMSSNAECQQPIFNTLVMCLQQSIHNQNMLLQYLLQQQQKQELCIQGQNSPAKDQIIDHFESDEGDSDEDKSDVGKKHGSKALKYEEDTVLTSVNGSFFIKCEEENRFHIFKNNIDSDGSGFSSESLYCKQEPDTESSHNQDLEENEIMEEKTKKKIYFKIIRRNDFKNSASAQNEARIKSKKSNKHIIPKTEPSRTKHLWINYGRKIIEYALFHTTDEKRTRVKQLTGKLGSKKDFIEIFGIKPTDTDYDRAFKTEFGKLALFFVEFRAESAFEDSKYKKQMIAQKKLVSSLIKQLISYSIIEQNSFDIERLLI